MPIVPKETFGKTRPCWYAKLCVDKHGKPFSGARCCQKTDSYYQTMLSDLHNLVPEISITSQQRGHYHFGDTTLPTPLSSSCHFVIDKKNKILSPAPELRGFIARAYLYMTQQYHLSLTEEQIILYTQWHNKYPPTQGEIERNYRIKKIQGQANNYIK